MKFTPKFLFLLLLGILVGICGTMSYVFLIHKESNGAVASGFIAAILFVVFLAIALPLDFDVK